MNICFFMEKIVSNIDFKFILNDKKAKSIAIFKIELNNKSKIMVEGYNEMADFCYSKLKQNDEVTLQGYLNREIKVILEDVRKNN